MSLQDVMHGDIDHFSGNRDFTHDEVNFAGLPAYIRHLQNSGMRFISVLVINYVFGYRLIAN